MENIIEMRKITKEFPGVVACDNITLELRKGEIHALLGENGAGKSTLMSVLFGLYQAEKGEILKNGKVVRISNPNDANALGIGMVHQHFKLVDVFTVLENIILGVEPHKADFVDKKEALDKLKALINRYNLNIDPNAIVEDITVGMQQRVEILKMLYRDNEILIFDEPTAVLTPQETEELMNIMRGLAEEGKSILFISHKLNEIMAVADRCTVLRKGRLMGTLDIAKTSKAELSRLMVGREINFTVEKADIEPSEEVLSVRNLSVPSRSHRNNAVKDVTFSVRKGEIVAIAGIDGNGQSELVYALTGLERLSGTSPEVDYAARRADLERGIKGKKGGERLTRRLRYGYENLGLRLKTYGGNARGYFVARYARAARLFGGKVKADPNGDVRGRIALCGKDITHASVRKRNVDLGSIPEDRHKFGLVLDFSLAYNLALKNYRYKPFQRGGFINESVIKDHADRLIKQFDIRCAQGAATLTRSMSGGNQQKAIVAREVDREPALLIAVQPTRGLDVGAIEYIHKQLVERRDAGGGVLLVSFELDEVIDLSDRILVMYNGEITGELSPKTATAEELGLYMSGAKRDYGK